MKSHRITLLALSALLLASPAFAAGKGTTMFGVGLSNGTADLYDPSGTYYLSAYDHSEIGAQAQVWHFLSDDYAVTFSGGVGFFSETDKPGNGAPATETDMKYTQSSYVFRVGGDRFVTLGPRAMMFGGPGIEYWTGKAKFEGGTAGSPTLESENVARISVSGRIGAIMKLGDNVGLSCQIGRKLGMASVKDKGREASWWPSSFDALGCLVFGFGN